MLCEFPVKPNYINISEQWAILFYVDRTAENACVYAIWYNCGLLC